VTAEFLDRNNQAWYRTIRLRPSRRFYEKASDVPEMALGQSRVGGPIVDLPEVLENPENMFFVAQLDLGWLSPCDKGEFLPAEGFLYFFYNYLTRGDSRQWAQVRYFPGSAQQLRRTGREHQGWFWRGTTLVECTAEVEVLQDRFKNDRWNYFAGTEKAKIGGYPSNPQWGEKEVASALNEDNNFLLLQIGEDITDGGCLCFFIDLGDCSRQDFTNVQAIWGQT
jgi:uncharacterized protein YwqG